MIKAKYRFTTINGFKLISQKHLPDFNVNCQNYIHQHTQAKLIRMEANDNNNQFAITFPTLVNNDKGTPHILEHLITCGSDKYPVRDPFMAMIKRSMNTYMNAWTGQDFISFPFSTQNEKDFHNLLSVYLDLVYKPRLDKYDFMQEGWRHFLNEQNQLTFKGVVFNEMKGYYESPEAVFAEYITKHMLNQTKYQYSSGGHPLSIPLLSYEELLEFYQKTFHPSNSIFFSYGNFDIQKITASLQPYLDVQPNKQRIVLDKSNFKKQEDILPLPGDKQSFFSVSYALKDSALKNPLMNFTLKILEYVLFHQPQGVLYQAILEAGLAESFYSRSGTDINGINTNFHFAFQGVDQAKKEQIITKINECLKDLVQNGIQKELVQSALHQTELSILTPTSSQGMQLFSATLSHQANDVDFTDHLQISELIKLFENSGENYLEQFIDQQFIKNDQNTTFYAQPDSNFLSNLVNQEQQLLEQMQKQLKDEDYVRIKQETEELQKRQELQQDMSILPDLQLSDIKQKVEGVEFKTELIEEVPVHFTKQNTNGLTFFKLKFNLGKISAAQRQYLKFFATVLPQMGTKYRSYQEMSEQFQLYTNGLNVNFDSFEDSTIITFSIASLNKNIDKMLDLIVELMTDIDVSDQAHMMTILTKLKIQLQNSLYDSSLNYASSLANSQLSQSSYISDIAFSTKFLLGLSNHYQKADGVSKHFYMDDFNFQIVSMLNTIFNKNRMEILVHSEQEPKKEIKNFVENLRRKFNGFNGELFDIGETFKLELQPKAILLPSQVNYVARAFKIPYYKEKDSAKLQILGKYLSNTQLHKSIREKGGAYGAGCSVNSLKGVMTFWSYRDPNILKTLDNFQKLEINPTKQELKEAKMSVFQALDTPESAQEKGVFEKLYGYTLAEINQRREWIMDTTADEMKELYEKYLTKDYAQSVVASEKHKDIEKLTSEFNFIVQKIE